MTRFYTSSIALAGLLVLSGCTNPPKHDPAFASVRPTMPAPAAYNNGAIYQSGHDVALFEDLKAHRVGDILTVTLEESTDASKQATTAITKQMKSDVTNPTILGSSPTFGIPDLHTLTGNGNSLETSVDSTHDFSGDGSADQKNSLTGSITVSVAEVLPNGNLVVRGEKVMTLNTGDEFIRLSGIVRPVDIGTDNSVSSTKVGNAEIIYSGSGDVQSAQVMGWLAKFFISALMPF